MSKPTYRTYDIKFNGRLSVDAPSEEEALSLAMESILKGRYNSATIGIDFNAQAVVQTFDPFNEEWRDKDIYNLEDEDVALAHMKEIDPPVYRYRLIRRYSATNIEVVEEWGE